MFSFNNHKNLEGSHAFFGASNYSWLNWSKNLVVERFLNSYATTIGTILHDYAKNCILHKIRLSETDENSIIYILSLNNIPREAYDPKLILKNMVPYVNDAIRFHATPEVILYYSAFCFGTTDAIVYDPDKKILRIFDYKSGSIKARIDQCRIYAAYFCLEYHIDPFKLKEIDLRIYQSGEQVGENADPNVIKGIMELAKENNELVTQVYERNK